MYCLVSALQSVDRPAGCLTWGSTVCSGGSPSVYSLIAPTTSERSVSRNQVGFGDCRLPRTTPQHALMADPPNGCNSHRDRVVFQKVSLWRWSVQEPMKVKKRREKGHQGPGVVLMQISPSKHRGLPVLKQMQRS